MDSPKPSWPAIFAVLILAITSDLTAVGLAVGALLKQNPLLGIASGWILLADIILWTWVSNSLPSKEKVAKKIMADMNKTALFYGTLIMGISVVLFIFLKGC